MTPFYFGVRPRRLFGIYDPARVSGKAARAAVLCHPSGDEHIHAYRTIRQLALRLSQVGFHVLRFDYYGTGDSAGDTEEGSIAGWSSDIEAAITELRDMTGCAKVTLVGLRLGATLAVTVAARGSDGIDNVVLWDPLIFDRGPGDGAMRAGRVAWEDDCGALNAGQRREIEAIDVPGLMTGLSPRALVLLTTQTSREDAFGSLAVERLDSTFPWVEERGHAGAIPANVLTRIEQWLT